MTNYELDRRIAEHEGVFMHDDRYDDWYDEPDEEEEEPEKEVVMQCLSCGKDIYDGETYWYDEKVRRELCNDCAQREVTDWDYCLAYIADKEN